MLVACDIRSMFGIRPTKRLLTGTLVSVALGAEVPPKAETAPAEPQVSKPASTSSGNRLKKK
jgi:hypothetical protein